MRDDVDQQDLGCTSSLLTLVNGRSRWRAEIAGLPAARRHHEGSFSVRGQHQTVSVEVVHQGLVGSLNQKQEGVETSGSEGFELRITECGTISHGIGKKRPIEHG